jgi:Flp pilus assembly protein TadD
MSQAMVARMLGELALGTGKLDRAAAWLELALALREDDAQALSGLARVRGQQGRHDEARQAFASAIDRAPEDPIPRLDHASYLISTVDGARPEVARAAIEDARTHVRAAIEHAPDSPEPHALLGLTCALDRDCPPREGIRALARAAALLPRDGRIHYLLAGFLLRAGDVEQARVLLRMVQSSAHGDEAVDWARALLHSLETPGP